MGLLRKSLSLSTVGLIDYKSDKERIAASTRKNKNATRKTNKLLKEQNALLRQQGEK
jgi:hypothetical protein